MNFRQLFARFVGFRIQNKIDKNQMRLRPRRRPVGAESLEPRHLLAVWSEQAELVASDAGFSDFAGQSVDIDGDFAVMGSPFDDDGGGASGSVYVFQRVGTTWTEFAKLTASDAAAGDQFGFDVAMDGDTIIVGAPFADTAASEIDAGAVYIFEFSGGAWSQTQKITNDPDFTGAADQAGARFGFSVDIDGDAAVVGADFDLVSAGFSPGTASVLRETGGVWATEQKLIGSDSATADEFGHSVAISGDTVVVGADLHDLHAVDGGAAYVFDLVTILDPPNPPTTEWQETVKLTNLVTPLAADNFGEHVDIDGDTVAIGVNDRDVGGNNNVGAVVTFTRSAGVWSFEQEFNAPAGDQDLTDNFGASVQIEGDLMVVGATGDDEFAFNGGATYVYERSGGVWSSQDKFGGSDTTSTSNNGFDVAIDAGTVIFGARGHDHDSNGPDPGGVVTNSGAAYIFVNPNDAPINDVPATADVNEDASLTFSSGGGNAISTSDVDAFGAEVEVTLTATNGLMTLGGTTGLTFSTGTGTNDSLMVFTGVIADISTALDGLVFTPPADFFGAASIEMTTDDLGNTGTGGPQSDTDTVAITVNAVNDAPSFTPGGDDTVNEDAGPQTVAGWATAISAGPANESSQVLTFVVTGNDNPGLFSAGPAIDPTTGDLTYTPAADANGSATIMVVLQDDGGTANGGQDTSSTETFTITVNAVNDAPTFTPGADDTVNEDAGAQTVAGWATAISVGPADESGQTLTFVVTGNDNPGLFSAGPAIDPTTGDLTYTPAADANGSATIMVVLQDDGGTANGGQDTSATETFTITVNAVNDAPSFTPGGDDTVNEDAGAQTVAGWATAISAGPANESGQTLTFVVTGNDNPGLFSAGPSIDPTTGDLTYTPAADANGSANITVVLQDDGGTANGGQDTSAAAMFTITVNPINDAPTADSQSLSITEDGELAITLSGSDVETAEADLVFTITSLPTDGTVTHNGDELEVGDTFTGPPSLVYEPGVASTALSDSFGFTVTDGGDPDGNPGDPPITSSEATIDITITKAVADGDVTLNNGILRVGGTSGNDDIDIHPSGADMHIHINGSLVTVPKVDVTEIRVWGREGNDRISVDFVTIDTILVGGAGHDRIDGSAGKDLIFGGTGVDILFGSAGNDVVVGGDGLDLVFGGRGHDIVVAGEISPTLTDQALRDISEDWAVNRVADEGPDDETLDESVEDDNVDLVHGGSGADWFIIGNRDWVLDFYRIRRDGDHVTVV